MAVTVVYGQSNVVYGPNVIGVIKVDLPANQMQIIAPSLNPLNSGSNNPTMTLDQVLGTNQLTAFYDPLNADNVFLWNGTDYLSAWLADDGWDDPGGVDWKWVYYDPSSGMPVPCADNPAYDIKVGQGLWLLHRNTATTIYLSGEIPQAAVITNKLAAGMTMAANPYPVTRTLDQLIGPSITGTTAYYDPLNADNVFLWTGSGYLSAWLADDGWGDPGGLDWKWLYYDPVSGAPALCATNSLFNLKPGQGLWYKARGSTFNWPIARPY